MKLTRTNKTTCSAAAEFFEKSFLLIIKERELEAFAEANFGEIRSFF
jgi:hypothetical protein